MAAVRRVASTIRQIEHQAERDRRRSPTGSRSARPAADAGGGSVSSGLTTFDDNGPGSSSGSVTVTAGLWLVEVRAVVSHSSPGFWSLFLDTTVASYALGPLVDPATGGGPDRIIVARTVRATGTRDVDAELDVNTTPGPDHLNIGGSITASWLRPLSPEGL